MNNKTNKPYLLILVLLITSFCFSQNSAIAKGYLKKATAAFEKNDFFETEQMLVKTKEYAGGTNNEIRYLEIKFLLATVVNVNEVKKECKLFLEEAFEDDERIEEITDLFIELESADYIDQFGNFRNKSKRSGKYFEYYPDGQLKVESYYSRGSLRAISSFYSNGKPNLFLADGSGFSDFKQFYPSGNIQFTATNAYGVIQGVAKLYKDGEFERSNQKDNLTKANQGKIIESDKGQINLLVPESFFKANNRKMKDWQPFLDKVKKDSINLYEGYSDMEFSDFDIILWDACEFEEYTTNFYDKVEQLLNDGKYIIVNGSNACISYSSTLKKRIYASEAANRLALKYGLKIGNEDLAQNHIVMSNNSIFPNDFTFLTQRAPFVSKTTNSPQTKLIAADSNSYGIIGMYENPNSQGKLFISGMPLFRYGLGAFNKETKDQDLRVIDVLFYLIEDYKKMK